MATDKDSKSRRDEGGVQTQLDRIAAGEQVEAGWCIDFGQNPAVYKCTDEDEAIARGDVSRSADGRFVVDLTTGEVKDHGVPTRTIVAPTLAESARAGGGTPTPTTTDTGVRTAAP